MGNRSARSCCACPGSGPALALALALEPAAPSLDSPPDFCADCSAAARALVARSRTRASPSNTALANCLVFSAGEVASELRGLLLTLLRSDEAVAEVVPLVIIPAVDLVPPEETAAAAAATAAAAALAGSALLPGRDPGLLPKGEVGRLER